MSIACLSIPHFALRIALIDRPQLDGNPLVLGNPESARATVLDATPEARDQGVQLGMTLREATAMCPAAIVLGADPVREPAIAQQITPGSTRSARLSNPMAGCWYIDLTGLDRYYGGQQEIVRPLLASAPPILRAHGSASAPASSPPGLPPAPPRPADPHRHRRGNGPPSSPAPPSSGSRSRPMSSASSTASASPPSAPSPASRPQGRRPLRPRRPPRLGPRQRQR